MKQFEYQILRYRPDQVSGEFVNVGLVLYGKADNYLQAESGSSTSRVKTLFPGLSGGALQVKLKQFSRRVNEAHGRKRSELNLIPATGLRQITHAALPPDDSSLYWSDLKLGMDVSYERAFNDLFERIVSHHLKHREQRTSDQAVWRDHYQAYFDRPDIKPLLCKHKVETEGQNTIEFDHAVKNGVWHFMEPVAFNLKGKDIVMNKVYKWMGKVQELEKSDEAFKLYLLTSLPEEPTLQAFVRERLEQGLTDGRAVQVVTPSEADMVVSQLVRAVEAGH